MFCEAFNLKGCGDHVFQMLYICTFFLGKACILKKNCVVILMLLLMLFLFVFVFFASMRAFEKCANSLHL